MPRLCEFYGIVIYMYWKDHAPPHFHAIYGGHEALVSIGEGDFIRGDLPRTARKLVLEWRALHVEELRQNWELALDPATDRATSVASASMDRLARVVAVEPLGGFRLRITFSDEIVRELDFDGVLQGGVFTELEDESTFAQVSVDEVAGTICWANGVDLDPDVLHGDFEPVSGRSPRLLRQYRLRPTG